MKLSKSHLRRAAKYALVLPILALVFWITGVREVFSRLFYFPLPALLVIVLLLGCNLWLVGFRFWRVLDHFSIRVSLAEASRASLAGHAVGLMLISLVGQVAGRQAILGRRGVSPVLNASLAGYERAVLAIVSGALALIAATYLLGGHVIGDFFHRVPLEEIGLLIVIGTVLSYWLGRTDRDAGWIKKIVTWQNLSRVGFIFALTLTGQLLVLLCFVVGVVALYGGIPVISVFAAAALISFAASLPITVNGWGVRELTSVFVLGKLGVSSADAVAISILIGLASTAVILFASPLLLRKPVPVPSCTNLAEMRSMKAFSTEMERAAAWFLGMSVAVAIFFQFHLELSAGVLNLNLADPLALLSLASVGVGFLIMQQPAKWRIAKFNQSLFIITGMLIFAFFIGWMKIGLTQWALGGRLLGWLVLIGYLSAGYILVSYGGNKWLRRLAEILTTFAVLIILWQIINRTLAASGWEMGSFITPNFEGYSGNRNAFAFQLLVVMAMQLALTKDSLRPANKPYARLTWNSFLLGTTIAGIIWTGSRAGFLSSIVLLLALTLWKAAVRRTIVQGLVLAGLFWFCQLGAQALLSGGEWLNQIAVVKSVAAGEASNNERWNTWVHALEIWRDSPIIGAGLGVFIAKSPEWLGHPQVIHSTPLWFLAEFGLMGIAMLVWACRNLVAYAFKKRMSQAIPGRIALALLLVAFGVFGLFHEIFYQRIFWFALGALLALPGAAVQAEK